VSVKDEWFVLPRGGSYVPTSAGAVQIGIPPETIKDVMAQKLTLPELYVVPRRLFDRKRGLSVAEFEFPAYYSFFLLKRKARLLVESADVEARIRQIFQETLFGPVGVPDDSEFASGVPLDARPDFHGEAEYFRNVPGRGRLEVDDLVEFLHFDGSGVARFGDAVRIERRDDVYAVFDGDQCLARIAAEVELPPRAQSTVDVSVSSGQFSPPDFGVTVLGASHGFDPSGKTTGFLLWMGGRALVVDPPTDATEYLRARGVAPKTIDGVVLTHCHADHDAGTFQKILEETKVSVYTTPHILASFLRKYSALSGYPEEVLRRTFVFHPVRIGAPVHVRGGELWFRYTLHSIPAVGLEAFYGGKSVAISGDTLYDPKRVREMFDAGVLGRSRFRELYSFRGHHNLILHEAGIPPLHTPTTALAELSPEVKKRVFLVHIAEKDVPRDTGLRPAKVGLEHTLRVDVAPPEHGEAIALLDAVSMVDFLRDLPLSRARQLLQVARRIRLPEGERIVTQGTRGDAFYIVVNGHVDVVRDGAKLKTYQAGDYFGERALLLDQVRVADVVAQTEVDLIAIDRDDFLPLLRGSEMLKRLERLVRVRDEGAWELIGRNTVLGGLTSSQKTQLQSALSPIELPKGTVLWSRGQTPEAAYLIVEGEVRVDAPGVDSVHLGPSAFVGEVDALRKGGRAAGSAETETAVRLFAIDREEVRRFFDDNPGLYLAFLGTRFAE
jgi:CRP-like cAMP-binding protein/glyoxylase-like metal-dependent hydrolase (beta-lactamase superfamily II)